MAKKPDGARMESTANGQILIVGATPARLGDFYHRFLRMPWWGAMGALVSIFLGANAIFAAIFVTTGGIAHARPGSYLDAFFFSVQTMGTIGYGSMYPESLIANVLVVIEAVASLVIIALATGLVFAKFSQSNARVVFSQHAVIAPMDGVPTLMVRVGNERSNTIIEAILRLVIVRSETTREGVKFYRMYDLPLTRERSSALSRSWTVMHQIVATSPFFGMTPALIESQEVEMMVTLVGLDDTSLQPVHARHTYDGAHMRWGARHADILSEIEDGRLLLDLRRFHDVVPTAPTDDFPYPAPVSGAKP